MLKWYEWIVRVFAIFSIFQLLNVHGICPYDTAVLFNGELRFVDDIAYAKKLSILLAETCVYIATYQRYKNAAMILKKLHKHVSIVLVPEMKVITNITNYKHKLYVSYIPASHVAKILQHGGLDFNSSSNIARDIKQNYTGGKGPHKLESTNQWSTLHVLISKFGEQLSSMRAIIRTRTDLLIQSNASSRNATAILYKYVPVENGRIYADSDRLFSGVGSDFVNVFKDIFIRSFSDYWRRPISETEQKSFKMYATSHYSQSVSERGFGCVPRDGVHRPRATFAWFTPPDNENIFAYHIIVYHTQRCSGYPYFYNVTMNRNLSKPN